MTSSLVVTSGPSDAQTPTPAGLAKADRKRLNSLRENYMHVVYYIIQECMHVLYYIVQDCMHVVYYIVQGRVHAGDGLLRGGRSDSNGGGRRRRLCGGKVPLTGAHSQVRTRYDRTALHLLYCSALHCTTVLVTLR